MVVVNVVMITLGQVIAYGIDAAFYHTHGGWRWMVGLGAVPSGLQLIFLFFLPESRECIYFGQISSIEQFSSARILIRRGNIDAARAILAKIYAYATPEQVDLKVSLSSHTQAFS